MKPDIHERLKPNSDGSEFIQQIRFAIYDRCEELKVLLFLAIHLTGKKAFLFSPFTVPKPDPSELPRSVNFIRIIKWYKVKVFDKRMKCWYKLAEKVGLLIHFSQKKIRPSKKTSHMRSGP